MMAKQESRLNMCKVGDIILIDHYIDHGTAIGRHSFIVVSDKNGEIEGCSYDWVCNVLSSFKNKSQKAHKMSYPGNYEIKNIDTVTNPDDGKDGFVKADQLYYFNKAKIQYRVIGYVRQEVMNELLEFIESGDFPIIDITDNL